MTMQEQGFYDIYGVWHVPFWQRPWFVWISIGFVLCILILLSWYLIKKYRTRNKKQIPYWQDAVNKLTILKQQNIATVEQGSKFYAQLTTILRYYLQNRYGFDMRGKTDDETIRILEDKQFDPRSLEQLKPIFHGGLYIKFANAQAIQQQIEKDLHAAQDFIKSSLKQEGPNK